MYQIVFNLFLLESKVISLCHQYRARPACTSMHSDQFLSKNDNGQFQKLKLRKVQATWIHFVVDNYKNGQIFVFKTGMSYYLGTNNNILYFYYVTLFILRYQNLLFTGYFPGHFFRIICYYMY